MLTINYKLQKSQRITDAAQQQKFEEQAAKMQKNIGITKNLYLSALV